MVISGLLSLASANHFLPPGRRSSGSPLDKDIHLAGMNDSSFIPSTFKHGAAVVVKDVVVLFIGGVYRNVASVSGIMTDSVVVVMATLKQALTSTLTETGAESSSGDLVRRMSKLYAGKSTLNSSPAFGLTCRMKFKSYFYI